jgi:nicotinamidase-related amidase
MITTDDTALVLIDIQEKLARAMHNKEALIDNLQRMVKGALVLELPILWAEQNPDGLGPTVREIADLLPDKKPVSKFSFSCCGNEAFMNDLKAVNCKNMLVAGIEAHVCVYQTVAEFVNLGFDVQVVADAVASRTPENRLIALEKCKAAGAVLTSTETALFELLKDAGSVHFKEIIEVVK